MRSRDIKKQLIAEGKFPAPTAEDLRIDAEIKAVGRALRKKRREQARTVRPPVSSAPHQPYVPRKRGPKPDPAREKCSEGWHTQLTVRESQALEALLDVMSPGATRSVFLRWVVCQVLEIRRSKDIPGTPFSVDLWRLDARSRRSWRPARSAGAKAA